MPFTEWKAKIAKSVLFPVADGRIVFFPYGPFKAWILPRSAFGPIVVNALLWFHISTVVSGILTAVIGAALGINMDILLLVGLLDYIHYHFRVRRITRACIRLPREFGIRLYAASTGIQKLWERLFSIPLMTLMFVGLALLVPAPLLLWGAMAVMFLWGAVIAYVIVVAHRHAFPQIQSGHAGLCRDDNKAT